MRCGVEVLLPTLAAMSQFKRSISAHRVVFVTQELSLETGVRDSDEEVLQKEATNCEPNETIKCIICNIVHRFDEVQGSEMRHELRITQLHLMNICLSAHVIMIIYKNVGISSKT